MTTTSSKPIRALTVLGLALHTFGAAASNSPVRVQVAAEQNSNTVTYCYSIVNNSRAPVNNLLIGSQFDEQESDSFPELGKLPLGWRFGAEGEVGTEIILDSQGARQPAGWSVSAHGKQDNSFYYLQWDTTPGGSTEIKPGQTLSGFCATVQKGRDPRWVHDHRLSQAFAEAASKYLYGHFNVTLPSVTGTYGNTEIYGDIERLDVTPPVLGVTATPTTLWPPNGKKVPINVRVSVSDEYDPAPEIRLESLTANEPLAPGEISDAQLGKDDRQFNLAAKRAASSRDGRVYTMTYSATDASGNKATAATTVVVPHDQGL